MRYTCHINSVSYLVMNDMSIVLKQQQIFMSKSSLTCHMRFRKSVFGKWDMPIKRQIVKFLMMKLSAFDFEYNTH